MSEGTQSDAGQTFGFQIPMRGNEAQQEASQRTGQQVSNPHEG